MYLHHVSLWKFSDWSGVAMFNFLSIRFHSSRALKWRVYAKITWSRKWEIQFLLLLKETSVAVILRAREYNAQFPFSSYFYVSRDFQCFANTLEILYLLLRTFSILWVFRQKRSSDEFIPVSFKSTLETLFRNLKVPILSKYRGNEPKFSIIKRASVDSNVIPSTCFNAYYVSFTAVLECLRTLHSYW